MRSWPSTVTTTVLSAATAVALPATRIVNIDDHRGADEGAAAARRGGRLAGRDRREALGGQVVDVVRRRPGSVR